MWGWVAFFLCAFISACRFSPGTPTDATGDVGGSTAADGGAPDAGPGHPSNGSDASVPPDSGVSDADVGTQCGNAALDPNEGCDDGDTQPGDGCSETCQIEVGWVCEGVPSQCRPVTPQVSILDAIAAEGERLRFRMTLSEVTSADVIVDWHTANGTAVTPRDYAFDSGMLTFPVGVTEAFLSVQTERDTEQERLETMEVVLSTAAGALIARGRATGSIAGPPLVDDGLVARYFLDEQESGPPTRPVRDAHGTPPFDLQPRTSDSGPLFELNEYGRHVSWTSADSGGQLAAPVGGTRIESTFDNTDTFTIEAVVHVDAADADSRIVHLGGIGDQGAFALIVTTHSIELSRRGALNVSWSVRFPGTRNEVVLTLTFNGDATAARDRAVLYVNGARVIARNPQQLPTLGSRISVDANDELVIGNQPGGMWSFDGFVGYLALYEVALRPSVVRQNAHRLLIWDDEELP